MTVLQPPLLGPRFARALQMAYELHWDQRKPANGAPYVAHALGVAALVAQSGGDEDACVAALLHDGPEARGGRETLEQVERAFGARVASLVRACGDPLEGMGEGTDWRKRKEAFVLHARKEADGTALLVGAADKLDNLRAILDRQRAEGDAVFERLEGGKEGRLWYYRALVEAYRGARADGRFPQQAAPLLDELERVLTQVESAAAGRRVL